MDLMIDNQWVAPMFGVDLSEAEAIFWENQDLTQLVLFRVNFKEMCTISLVCKSWQATCSPFLRIYSPMMGMMRHLGHRMLAAGLGDEEVLHEVRMDKPRRKELGESLYNPGA